MNDDTKPRFCRNCRHFHQTTNMHHPPEWLKDNGIGECCAHAPRPLTVPDREARAAMDSWAVFPLVEEDAVCGEFQPRAGGRTRGTRTVVAGRGEGFRPFAATRFAKTRGRTHGTP